MRTSMERFGAPFVTLVVAIVAIVLLEQRAVSSDGASYLAISRHWAEGEWTTAINGYWSPLLSLLIAPAAILGIPLIAAAKIFAGATSVAAICAVQRLMRVGGADPTIAAIVAVGASPFAVFAAIDNLTPDLLMATLLVLFVAEMVGGLQRPVVAGLLGGAAFLAKAYALPFIVVYPIVVAVAAGALVRFARRGDRGHDAAERMRWALRRLLRTAAVAAAIAVGWSALISIDEGRVTFSTSAEYNSAISQPGSPGNPYSYAGLIDPDHPTAFWGWEDPPKIVPEEEPVGDDASAGASATIETRTETTTTPGRVDRVTDNIVEAARSSALVAGSVIAAVITLLWASIAAVATLRERRASVKGAARSVSTILHLGLATAVYVSGLLVLVVNARYLYFAMLLAVAIGALGVSELAVRFPDRRRAVLALALILAMATAGRSSVALYRLDERADASNQLDDFLSGTDLEGLRISSSPVDLTGVGARCLDEGCVYLGRPIGRDADVLAGQFAEFDVDVFIVRTGVDVEIPVGARLLDRSDAVGLIVYDVSAVETPS
ncbi:MAG: hypothetical protein WA964_09285 [Ilumatobacter sp.]|uniref:hypothetical protein n=1 Tax=Ilumatobacter sp. TaxID=1967498 RepID=UPI003C76CDB0